MQNLHRSRIADSSDQNSNVSSGFDSLAAPSFMPPLPVDPVRLAPSLPPRDATPIRPLPLPRAAGLLLFDEPAQTQKQWSSSCAAHW